MHGACSIKLKLPRRLVGLYKWTLRITLILLGAVLATLKHDVSLNGNELVPYEPVACKNFVFPHLQGGLGNQLFIMSVAAIIASSTGRCVMVNAKQTGVYSFGVPQPVYWHTIFHSPFIRKANNYVETSSFNLGEDEFSDGLSNSFVDYVYPQDLVIHGAFLHFSFVKAHDQFLSKLFEPTSELQRWINDAAGKMGLTKSSSESDVSSVGMDSPISMVVKSHGTAVKAWHCELPPKPCNKVIRHLECEMRYCQDNVAVQFRLRDSSTHKDYWNAEQTRTALRFISKCLEKNMKVVVFSNHPLRAKSILAAAGLEDAAHPRLFFSSELNVIEFFLMAQYFGTHLMTGSTFQLWAIFLSPLKHVRTVIYPGNEDLLGLDHGTFSSFRVIQKVDITHFLDDDQFHA